MKSPVVVYIFGDFHSSSYFFILKILNVVGKKHKLQDFNSLFNLAIMDTKSDLNFLELSLRELNSGMHKSGENRRRKLLIEGKALLKYILRCDPNMVQIITYVRIIEKLRNGTPLYISKFILAFLLPFL